MNMHDLRTRAARRRAADAIERHFELRRYAFAQDDLVVANAALATVRANINANLQALGTLMSGSSAPGTTYAYMLWADTSNGLLKQRNAANSGWIVRGTLSETFVVSRSSNTILAGADVGKTIIITANTFSQTLTAAATLGDGWWCVYRNSGTGTVTLDPNSSETIDGSTTLALGPGQGCLIYCNGSAFFTVGLALAAATQADQETGTSLTTAVTPGRQHYHPSAAKAWCFANFAGSSLAGYNMTSVTDQGTGQVAFNWDTDFSSANYSAVATVNYSPGGTAATTLVTHNASQSAGQVQIYTIDCSAFNIKDGTAVGIAAFGDHA